MNEHAAREHLARLGAALYARGLAPGSSGNLSVRIGDGYLVTPTNSCLGRLDPAAVSKLDAGGRPVSGDPPSKEAVLHLSVYGARPSSGAVVHLHSPYAVALSCLADVDPADVLPAITPYYVMRVGTLPLVPYHRPGDRALADAVGSLMGTHSAALLANHGSVVAGASLDEAVYAAEELEETAKLFFVLRGCATRYLTAGQIAELHRTFPRV